MKINISGRHGYGAKLTNLFSHKFTVETASNGKYFKQSWKNNMEIVGEAYISEWTDEEFTRITFQPDLVRLCPNRANIEKISGHDREAIIKRCCDIAGTANIHVSVNGSNLDSKGWEK